MVRVKRNFSNQYKQNLSCKFGCIEDDSQEHLLDCKFLINKLEDKFALAEIEYDDIFGNMKQQVEIAKIRL